MRKQAIIDWILPILLSVIVLVVFLAVAARAQPAQPQGLEILETTTTTQVYEYDGWKHDTKLKGNWSGDKPPGSNDRLYEYRDGAKTGEYYEHNGYEWKPKGSAYSDDLEDNEFDY